MRNRSLTAPELVASSLLLVCGMLTTGCPKQQDGGASAEAAASAKSAAAKAKAEDQDDEKADDKDDDKDDDEKDDGKKDKGGW
jgi:hypothetical protein